ncbi:MAG: GapR family DNA-binding domain-containing protein [Zymomonas mobilis]|uniref:GapR family DNA-binding domain-containing protein n=1 Tax=Zymomonas mobilis TaxID=542 RepID=UPI0039E8A044
MPDFYDPISAVSQELDEAIQRLVALENEKSRLDEQISDFYHDLKKKKFDVKKLRHVVAGHRNGQPDRVLRPLVDEIAKSKVAKS